MLREATSALIDDARLDHTEIESAVPDHMDLGAALDGASREVRDAAVRRSRRLPEPRTIQAAWASLPAAVRDRIGVMALTHSFYSEVSARDDYRYLTLEAGRRCGEWEGAALNGIEAVAIAALPELYGTDDEEPTWTRGTLPTA